MPGILNAIQDEEEGIPWLDTVEHMLIKNGDSLTDAYSGLVVAGWESGKLTDHKSILRVFFRLTSPLKSRFGTDINKLSVHFQIYPTIPPGYPPVL